MRYLTVLYLTVMRNRTSGEGVLAPLHGVVIETAVLTEIAHFYESVVSFHNPTIGIRNFSIFPDVGCFDMQLIGRQFRRMPFHEIAMGSARERDTRTIVEQILSRMNWRVPIVIGTFRSALSRFERLPRVTDLQGFLDERHDVIFGLVSQILGAKQSS